MSNIFLHFLADFPVLVKAENEELGVLENLSDILSIEVCTFEDIVVQVFPVLSKNVCASIPYAVKLNFKNNFPYTENEYVEITNFGNNNFEVKFYPMPVLIHKKPICIDTQEINSDLLITIFDDGEYNLEINTKNKLFKFTLSEKIFDYKFTFYNKNETDFLILEGKTSKNQCFLMIFANFFCNLEIIADFIERTKTEITALTYQNDIAKHGVVQKYILEKNHFTLNDEYTVFLDNTPHKPQDPNLIPWAFAEAINVGDLNLARSYLDNSLNKILSDEQLTSFFGDYNEIKWNRYKDIKNSLCFMYNNSPRETKTFQFEMLNNKISNISELDWNF